MNINGSRLDPQDMASTHPVRSMSMSSDVMSNSTRSANTLHHVPHANPPPAYIAEVEASDLISGELDRKVIVSASALTLLNEFLDHVLHSIIATSHSVTLGQLKAAVPAVLKPRLGKLALAVAEEELKEYIEDEEVEELYSNNLASRPKSDFDVDLVWKLARLRCMVYARMGDLEEEDEEEWLEKERLLEQAASFPTHSRQSMVINPGAAIFLTSVIEYLGEQALYYAAQHAQKRHDIARNHSEATPESGLAARESDIVLEGKDMNHVGRESPLSRLWRSWRRTTRSPGDALSRPMSPELSYSPDGSHSRAASSSNHPLIAPILEEAAAHPSPSQIPLPMSANDIEEIEGLDSSVVQQSSSSTTNGSRRPLSMPVMSATPSEEPLPSSSPTQAIPERNPLRMKLDRYRSNSLPVSRTPLGTADYEGSTLTPQVVVAEEQAQGGVTTNEASSLHAPQDTDSTKAQNFAESSVEPAGLKPKTSRDGPSATAEQRNDTAGAIASALGIVGVHHIQQGGLQPQSIDAHPMPSDTSRNVPEDSMPLTSASITGPSDFDMMHVPQARSLSEDRQAAGIDSSATGKAPSDQRHSAPVAYPPQNEELVSYSRDVHEMKTPSIYSNQEHSPRFPKDMRPVSRQSEPPERIESHYAPTPEPDTPYHGVPNQYHVLPAVPEKGKAHVRDTDSPVSMISNKFSNKPQPVVTKPVPQIPTSSSQQGPAETAILRRNRGHSKSSSSSSKLLGFTRDSSGRPQTIHQQRAAGDMSDEMRHAYSSTPTDANEHFDFSDIPSSQRRQHLRIRSESDNPYPSGDDPKRSLEKLIKSDETLHYTLTPATATFNNNDVPSSLKRTQTQDLADFLRNTAPPGQEVARPKTSRSHKISMDAARAPQLAQTPERVAGATARDAEDNVHTPKPKLQVGAPRDPKLDRMSGVRDLADYARTTGPTTDDQLPKPVVTKAASTMTSRPATSVPKTLTSSTSTKKPTNRLKFQARDPRPSRHAESTALIDFIREGPPREAGDHRINRNIAPFRTTMDSDDLNALASSIRKSSLDANGVQSVDTSVNSQSPLLTNGVRATNLSKPSESKQSTRGTSTDDEMPKKTRRRVKDPYAIDDDDDDELFKRTPRQTNEESLIDFLRNTAPTQQMTALPVLSSTQQAQASLTNKASADRLKEIVRVGRTNTSDGQNAMKPNPRAESPHLTQIGSKLDSYRPTQATHAAHVDRNRQKARTDTQNPVKAYGETADLAEYLRTTGPPANLQPTSPNRQLTGGSTKEEGGGLRKFFSLRGRK